MPTYLTEYTQRGYRATGCSVRLQCNLLFLVSVKAALIDSSLEPAILNELYGIISIPLHGCDISKPSLRGSVS